MANEVLKFLNGQATNLANKTVKAGQVYFAINSDGETGSIYFDAPISSSVTKRIAMSGQQVQHAVEADYATHDDLGNVIKETYISQLRLDSAGTKIQYKYPGTQTWSELQPLFLPLAGGQITNDLGVNGTITAGNLIVNGAARFVQTILGNIQTADKWSTARNFSISDATAAHTGTAVSVDGSTAVTIPLPATITATLKGNADTATTATNANNLQAYNSNEVTIGANSTTAGSSTNSAVYINHKDRSNGSTSNGSTQITDYYFENRKGATTGVTIHAATFAGNASSADIWSTGRKFSISDNDATNTGTQVTVNGGADYVLPLPSTIKASLTGNATTATKASKLAVGTAITTAENLDAFLEASVLKATIISTGVTYSNGTLSANDGEVISIGYSNTTYGNQIFFDPDTDKISVRRKSSTWKPWIDLIHTGNISSYTAGAAGKWSTKRKFSISDSDASHTGTQVEVDGSADYVLPLPSTIKASLQGNADSATKATKDSNDKTITDEYLHRAANSASTLNQFSGAPSYILGIEAFASGGEVKWQSASSVTVGKATTADTWTTARNFAISDDSGSNTGTAVSVKGNDNVTLPLPTQIYVTGNHMGFINGGETDKFFDFAYAANPTASTAPGASWRIGALNSGSGDTNYFVIQTGGSGTSATTWNNALRIGMNTLDIHVGGNLNPFTNNTKTLGTSSLKWANVYATTFTGDLSGNAATATKWKDARNFSVSDATAAHTGTAQSVNGTGNVVLPLPSTITATLDGNASTATKATQDSDGNAINTTYLKKSGGEMTGTAVISWANSGSWGSSNPTFPLKRGGLYWSGTSDWIDLFAEETSSDNFNLIINFGDDATPALILRDRGTDKIILKPSSSTITATTFEGTASYASKDTLGNPITTTYISQLRLDSAGTTIQYKYPGNSTWNEIQPLFLPLAGGQITNDLSVDGTITANNLIVNGSARFVQTILGNIQTADKWKTARNFAVSDATAAHTGTAVSIDGSAAVTLPLPATITATLKGNADTATTSTNAYNVLAYSTNETTIGANSTTAGASTNDTVWFNYRDVKGGAIDNNATKITKYYFGNRKGNTNDVTVYAATFSGNATSADKWKTSRNFQISDADATNTGTAVSVNGSSAVVLPLPSTIKATLQGNADSATVTRYVSCPDTRSTAIAPQDLTAAQGVQFNFKQKSVTGLTAAYAGVMSFRPYSSTSDWSGGPAHEIAFDANGIYHRKSTDSTTWGAWETIIHSGNIENYTSSSADTWTTARNFSISDATAAHTGTAVSVDGSSAVTLPLPSTITATIVGNASSATKAYVTIADTTKFYLIGSTNTSSGNADLKEDTGLYAGTTKGQLGAAYVGINGDNTSYRLYVNGASLMTDTLKINTSTGELEIGSKNSSWTHFTANKDFYFSRQASINGNFLPYTDLTYNLGSESYRWLNVYANVLRLQGASSNPATNAGARIEFTYDNGTSRSQPVYISYTPNDSYRAPAGLKIMGNGGDSSSAWLEVEGAIHSNGIVYAKATTDSSSTSTGAVVVTGGVGIAKQLRVGGNTNLGGTLGVSGATTLASTLTVSGNTSLNGNLTVASNKTTSLGGTLSVSGVATFSNQIKVEKNTDSTKSTDGNASIVTDGGVSVAKQLSAKMIKIDNGQASKGCQLIYNETVECLEFVFS